MHKSSKKIKGPVTEDIPEAPSEEQSADYMIFDQGENVPEAPTKNLIECAPFEKLEPEEVGIQIYVFAPKHSKSFRKLAAMQFQEGRVEQSGTVLLSDGQLIRAGATVKTEMTSSLKVMLRDGVFLAGKAPRRE